MATSAAPSRALTEWETPAATVPAKLRDPLFDNAKFVAIVLVVVGHAIGSLLDVPVARSVYLFFYMFHMPVFILVAGYFSRGYPASSDKVRRLLTQLLVPYVVFQLAYMTLAREVGGRHVHLTLLDPYFMVWFLLALLAWRLSTPVWQRLRWPLGIAAGISVLAGMQDLPSALETGRILGLLPFFVLGLQLRPEHIERLRRPLVRAVSGLVMLCALGMSWYAAPRMSLEWATWRHSNEDLQVDDVTGTAMRIAMLACATILSAAFLSLMPKRRTWFTRLGTATLYVYLLHGVPVKICEYVGLPEQAWLHTNLGVLAAAAASVVLALLLATPPVRWCTRWAIAPRLDWAFRPRPAPVDQPPVVAGDR